MSEFPRVEGLALFRQRFWDAIGCMQNANARARSRAVPRSACRLSSLAPQAAAGLIADGAADLHAGRRAGDGREASAVSRARIFLFRGNGRCGFLVRVMRL